jgi:hypothetical protein
LASRHGYFDRVHGFSFVTFGLQGKNAQLTQLPYG